MKELDPNTVESSQLVEEAFNFWFKDNEHIRSPFPAYIHAELKEKTTEGFFLWSNNLNEKAKDEVNQDVIGEKFEEILFENALKMVLTEDEKITIKYPFLPRVGDPIFKTEADEESKIVDRSFTKEGDHDFLKVNCENTKSGEKWETKFELP